MSVYVSYQKRFTSTISIFPFLSNVCDQLSGLVMERRRPTGPGNGRTNAGSDFELCCVLCCVLWGKLKTPKYLGIDNA